MRTVKDWKALGFHIAPVEGLNGITEISSDQPFWYFNAQFHRSEEAVRRHLEEAIHHGDRYRLILTGPHCEDSVLPVTLVTPAQKARMDRIQAEIVQLRAEIDRAAGDYLAVLSQA